MFKNKKDIERICSMSFLLHCRGACIINIVNEIETAPYTNYWLT